jgi:hypothetical protein
MGGRIDTFVVLRNLEEIPANRLQLYNYCTFGHYKMFVYQVR